MARIRVIPTLLYRNTGLVKTVRFKDAVYVGDAVNAVRIFNDKEVDELVFLDIAATVDQRPPNFQLIAEVASECFMPVCYGGGVSTIEHIRDILHVGIEKVAINTKAVLYPRFIREAADRFGSSTIVVSIDVKKSFLGKYEVYTHGGRQNAKLDPVVFAQQMEDAGAGEILLNSIDQDGMMKGYDLALIKKVAAAVSIPVVCMGGAGQLSDFSAAIQDAGASAVSAGSMFVFHGKHKAVLINYPNKEKLDQLFQ